MYCYILICVCCTVYTGVLANKYAENINRPLTESDRPFRMLRVNTIWEKAKKIISGPRLADLYAELAIQDKAEMGLKKLKSEDMDKYGLKEAEVRENLLETLYRFGLSDIVPPRHVETNQIPDAEVLPDNFRDKRLNKLWKKAQLGGFTEEELNNLKEEFWHQQMKIDEFESLKDNGVETNDIMDNRISSDIKNKDDFLKMNSERRRHELKQLNRELKEQYDELGNRIEETEAQPEFSDQRVYELWALAKKSNMSESELSSFREELRHFQLRIDKHEFFRSQLDLEQKSYHGKYKEGELPERHLHLQQKTEDLDKKVRKYHTHLSNTVDKALKRHSEL